MRTSAIQTADWRGVFPVPPLCRRTDARRSFDFAANRALVDYMGAGGTTRLIYGGNAFLYHITLGEYEELLGWLQELPDQYWCIPSAGPSYGRMMDQAPILRRHKFPTVMHLPCGDPRDAAGLEAGLREFADACGLPLMLYVKDENNYGTDLEAGLDAIGRLAKDGICIGIKYAVIRNNPAVDPYLSALLQRVDRNIVISGIGERPAIDHLRTFGLPGFTTGSGCLAPALSHRILELCHAGRYGEASPVRELFIPHEDLRDAWGPARVLHAATQLAGIAQTGAIPPFTSPLNSAQCTQLAAVAKALVAHDTVAAAAV